MKISNAVIGLYGILSLIALTSAFFAANKFEVLISIIYAGLLVLGSINCVLLKAIHENRKHIGGN